MLHSSFYPLHAVKGEDGCADWGFRICRQHLCRGIRPHSQRAIGYDTKPSDGEDPIPGLLDIWITSLPLLPGPLSPGAVVPVMVLSICQRELFNPLQYLKPFNCIQPNE